LKKIGEYRSILGLNGNHFRLGLMDTYYLKQLKNQPPLILFSILKIFLVKYEENHKN